MCCFNNNKTVGIVFYKKSINSMQHQFFPWRYEVYSNPSMLPTKLPFKFCIMSLGICLTKSCSTIPIHIFIILSTHFIWLMLFTNFWSSSVLTMYSNTYPCGALSLRIFLPLCSFDCPWCGSCVSTKNINNK